MVSLEDFIKELFVTYVYFFIEDDIVYDNELSCGQNLGNGSFQHMIGRYYFLFSFFHLVI